MRKLSAVELIDLVEKQYFSNVDGKNLETVLKCFAEDSVLRVKTADVTRRGRDGEIRQIFANLMKNTRIIHHGEFSHVVDVENQKIACEFLVRNDYDDGRRVEMRNCNFFEIRNGLFQDVSVYMSGENTLV